jgi:hypothetical protein
MIVLLGTLRPLWGRAGGILSRHIGVFPLALGFGVGWCLRRLMSMRFHGTYFLSGLFALPLSGAGLTFFAAAKKVREGLNNPFSALDI